MNQHETKAIEAKLQLIGLDCADCAQKLANKIKHLPNVVEAEVNFGASKLTVLYSGSIEEVIAVVKQAGYGVKVDGSVEGITLSNLTKDPKLLTTIASGLFLLTGFFLDVLGGPEIFIVLSFLSSIATGGFYIARAGLTSLRTVSLDMNFLMTLAVIGAIGIGEYSEGAMVVFLYSVGNTLQGYTMDKTRKSIRELMKLAPKEAMVLEMGLLVKKDIKSILPGELVLVRPGERVAVDGTVMRGSSAVNQAPITGESMPANKKPGDTVYAGSINQKGALEIRVTKKASDTTLAKIIHLVEEAQAQKAPSQQFIDVFAKYYTPIVVVIALFVSVIPYLFGLPFMPWFKKSLILLVIACPCALVISTPVTIVAGIGSAARKGVLIKGGAHLEKAGKIAAIAFDKTGTLTKGLPEIVEVIDLTGEGPVTIIEAAAAVEKYSEHPVAEAVKSYAAATGIVYKEATGFQALPGLGVTAMVDGIEYLIGNRRLFRELGVEDEKVVEITEGIENAGRTALLVGTNQAVIGIIAVADTVRPESERAIAELHKIGIGKIIMLTGDNKGTAQEVASQLNIDEFRAELLPEDKLNTIKELGKKYGRVAMVGDGINDAPAMAAASMGIAMGGAGTDSAMETADIVLMSDDISKLTFTMKLSRKALRILKQNIIFSVIIKAAFIVLTFLGLSNLWMAVFADTGAALIVIANGMRLASGKP